MTAALPVARRPTLPVPLALLSLLVGGIAMLGIAGPAVSRLGTRPGLLVAEACLAAPGVLGLAFLGVPLASSLGLRSPGRRVLGLALLAGGALWGASLGLFEVQSLLWPPSDEFLETFQRLHEALRPTSVLDGVASLTAIALVPACCEELLFRGVLLPSLARSWGPAVGVLGSAVLFGLIHLMPVSTGDVSFYRVPFAFSVGVGLAILRLRTGSLLPSILAHATLNTITFLAAIPLAQEGLQKGNDPLAPAGVPLLAVGTAAFLFLIKRLNLDLIQEDA
jgi:membrane protease YdiL (CAAX protease family)